MAASDPSAAAAEFTQPGFAVSLLGAALPGLYLLITSTTYTIPGIWPYDAKRLLQFFLLILILLLPALNRGLREQLAALILAIPNWYVVALTATFAWGAVSASINAQTANHLASSLSEVALLLSLVLSVLIVAACRRVGQKWFDRVAISLLALTGLIVGVQELVGVAAAQSAGLDFSYDTALQYFSKPRFYNQFQSWTMPVIVALPLIFPGKPLARWLCLIVLALHWYVLLMTAGRGTAVSLAGAILFAVTFLPAARTALLKWQLGGLLLGALIYASVLFTLEGSSHDVSVIEARSDPAVASAQDDGSLYFDQSLGRPMLHTSGRSWIWSRTLRDVTENSLLGIGPMNYACTNAVWYGHPHNFPLQIAAEWGLPAALILAAVFVGLLASATRRIRRLSSESCAKAAPASLLLTGVLAAAIHSCFSGVLVMPASQVTGVLVCGVLLGSLAPAQGHRRTFHTRWIVIAGSILSLALLIQGGREISTMEERAAQLPPRIFAPRIWQDSKVCVLYTSQNEVNN